MKAAVEPGWQQNWLRSHSRTRRRPCLVLQLSLVEGRAKTVQARCGQLQAALEAMVMGCLPARATLLPPESAGPSNGRWVAAFEAWSHWGTASTMLSQLSNDRDLEASGR
jgi:hypothetical protein